jgi:hypothetical protein
MYTPDDLTEEEAFAHGARCGHIDGQGRAGSYVIGEEIELAWDATQAQGFSGCFSILKVSRSWERGYQQGYILAAEGSPLIMACDE